MAKPGLAARAAANKLVLGVLRDGISLNEASGDILDKLQPAERARAQSLADTVLRHGGYLSGIVAGHVMKTPPTKVEIILAVATAELVIDQIAAHAVVDAAVMMTKRDHKIGHLSGLVNAVCRKIAADAPELLKAIEPGRLPDDMRENLVQTYGRFVVGNIEKVQAKRPSVDLCLMPGVSADETAVAVDAEILPTGNLRLNAPKQISSLPGFAEGQWWVQDAAASLPVRCFGDMSGKSVLDLCAAPGGKTMQLAAMGADVVAVDISKKRLKRVTENLTRTGLKAQTLVADALQWSPSIQFDGILLDAPCSATGTMRRHPDLPYVNRMSQMDELTQLQAKLLRRAAEWTLPGGTLVYATCSLFVEEGEQQITRFLKKNAGWTLAKIEASEIGCPADWVNDQGCLRTRPDHWMERGGVDGFFVAKLVKDLVPS